jgi:hypothetical protein
MEIWTQVFTRHVAGLQNRDWLVDQSGVVKPTTWWCARAWRWLGREPEVLENGVGSDATTSRSCVRPENPMGLLRQIYG